MVYAKKRQTKLVKQKFEVNEPLSQDGAMDEPTEGCIQIGNQAALTAIAINVADNCSHKALHRYGCQLIVELEPKAYEALAEGMPGLAQVVPVFSKTATLVHVTFARKDQLKRLVIERHKNLEWHEINRSIRVPASNRSIK